jgi:curved DNA-binding protein CbpA
MPKAARAPAAAEPKPTLYELLRVERTATAAEIRKAYLVMARLAHPDKNPEPGAKEAFQALKRAYDILIDADQRSRYDRTGLADDEGEHAFWDAYERFRGIKVTAKDIEAAEAEYRDSKEEQDALVAFFDANRGDVTLVLGFIVGSRNEDRARYVQTWEQHVASHKPSKQVLQTFARTKKAILSLEELDELDGEDIADSEENDDDDDEGQGEQDEDEAASEDSHADDDACSDASAGLLFEPGEQVMARWKEGRTWYLATVTNAANGAYSVKYAKDNVMEHNVKPKCVKTKPQDEPRQNKRAKTGDQGDVPDMDALRAAIENRGQVRAGGFAQFEDKWAGKKKAR